MPILRKEVEKLKARYAPKFKIGDKVKVYIDWIGYQTDIIIGMNDKSIVYDWLYDIKIDGGQETTREYTYNRCDLDIVKIKE